MNKALIMRGGIITTCTIVGIFLFLIQVQADGIDRDIIDYTLYNQTNGSLNIDDQNRPQISATKIGQEENSLEKKDLKVADDLQNTETDDNSLARKLITFFIIVIVSGWFLLKRK